MTYVLNTPSGGAANIGNTGIAPKQIDFKRIRGFFILPLGAYLTAAEILDLKAKLQEKTTLDDRTARYFPVWGITDFADSDTAPEEWASGYGEKEITGDGKYNFTVTFRDGGVVRHQNLRQFNDETNTYILVDRDGTLWGYGQNGNLYGLSGKMYTPKFKLAGNSDPALFQTNLTLTDPGELNDLTKLGYVDTDNTINFEREVPGVVNLTLIGGTPAAGFAFVGVKTTDGMLNMYDTYDDEFADTDAWTAVKASDGTALTISAVTKNAATKEWKLAITYVGEVIISLAGPTALAVLHIGGAPALCFEGMNTASQTLPTP